MSLFFVLVCVLGWDVKEVANVFLLVALYPLKPVESTIPVAETISTHDPVKMRCNTNLGRRNRSHSRHTIMATGTALVTTTITPAHPSPRTQRPEN